MLRTVKYGETSVVVTMITQVLGLQSYLVNGVRSSSKSGTKAILFQPATLLQLETYHHPTKNLQRLKEYSRSFSANSLFENIAKNCVALFMVELLLRTLKQPEPQEELYHFAEDSLLYLDRANPATVSVFPIWFAVQLPQYLGIGISPPAKNISPDSAYFLDFQNGNFLSDIPAHQFYLNEENSKIIAEILRAKNPDTLVPIPRQKRKTLLPEFMMYYTLHIEDFVSLRSLAVMQGIFQ